MIYGKYIRSANLISIETGRAFEPVAGKAYRVLEHMIVTLELPPSSFVTEGALIDRLGLGRTPVREAIQRLAWEGLLDVRPRAGIAVAPLHAGDWLRVLDARRGIEVVLARSAARFVTRDAADLFHDAALAMQKAVVSGNVFAFIEADKALDEALAVAADNPFAIMRQTVDRRGFDGRADDFPAAHGVASQALRNSAKCGSLPARSTAFTRSTSSA